MNETVEKNEGEFKRRIHAQDRKHLKRAKELYSYVLSTKVESWLDEARKDFPVYPKEEPVKKTWQEIVDFYIELTSRRDKWFLKWFGNPNSTG